MAEKEVTNKDLQGINGWLLFFVIWIGISIILFPIQLIGNLNNPLFSLSTIYIIISIFSLLLTISIFILIFTKKSWVPKYIILIIWLQFLIGLTSFLTIKFNFSSQLEAIAGLVGLILGIVFSLAWAILFTIYLVKSQRVKNTFVN
ncbi:MAG TPA: DUF2569 family protein [Candidatus Paceibacterota bacterium]|nr:DUF2569 family protein [Candidatus Paceibacterota bacterium]